MTKKLDDTGCQVLPEEDYPRSLVGMLPAGKRVNVRVDVPNQEDENSAAIAYWQVSRPNPACRRLVLPPPPFFFGGVVGQKGGIRWFVYFRHAKPC